MNRPPLSRGPVAGASAEDPVERLLTLAGPQPAFDTARAARLRSAIEPEWRRVVGARRARRRVWGALAAAASLAVAVWSLSFLPRWRSAATVARLDGAAVVLPAPAAPGPGRALATGQRLRRGDVVATEGGRVALRLANGTELRLDRASRLAFDGGNAMTLAAGALYIDTGDGGSARRVRIATPLGRVEDVGTRFEIRLSPEELRLRTRDGAVRVEGPRGTYFGEAGEELTLSPDGEVRRSSVPTHGDPWSWTLEVAVSPDFDGHTLDELLAWAARETGRRVRYAPGARELSRDARVHGDVAGLPALDAVDVALAISGLRSRLEGGELILEPVTP